MKHWNTEYQLQFIMVPLQHRDIFTNAGAGKYLITYVSKSRKKRLDLLT